MSEQHAEKDNPQESKIKILRISPRWISPLLANAERTTVPALEFTGRGRNAAAGTAGKTTTQISAVLEWVTGDRGVERLPQSAGVHLPRLLLAIGFEGSRNCAAIAVGGRKANVFQLLHADFEFLPQPLQQP